MTTPDGQAQRLRDLLPTLAAEAFAAEVEEARTAGELGYYARILTQATMPHSRPDTSTLMRQNGALTLRMAALGPGLPYGSIPRLLLAWVTTEAVRTKDRELVLGDHLAGFMRQLDLVPTGGRWGTIPRLRSQMTRLFSTAVGVTYSGPHEEAGMGWMVADRYRLWWDPKAPNQAALWQSTVTLGEPFYKAVVERPVPVDMRALRALRRSPLALDIYTWLTYRMSYLRRPVIGAQVRMHTVLVDPRLGHLVESQPWSPGQKHESAVVACYRGTQRCGPEPAQ